VPTTSVSRLVAAPRDVVYRALLDPAALAAWRVPDGMRAVVHELEPVEGGRVRMSLTYEAPDAEGLGKSGGGTDTFSGRFARIVPGVEVVEVLAFESADPALTRPLTQTTRLEDALGGTLVTIVHEDLPDAVRADQNELGTRMALERLARLVEPA
jgi:uncharacterized protein YndB with AHSA1/START domain